MKRGLSVVLLAVIGAGLLAFTSSRPAWACSCEAPGVGTVLQSEAALIGFVTGETWSEIDELVVYEIAVEVDARDNLDDVVNVAVFNDSCQITLFDGDVVGLTVWPGPNGLLTAGSCDVVPPEAVEQALGEVAPGRPLGAGLTAQEWDESGGFGAPPGMVEEVPPPALEVPPFPVDENGNPMPFPVDENGNPMPFPGDEDDSPVPVPIAVDDEGNPLPVPVGPDGVPTIPTPMPPFPVDDEEFFERDGFDEPFEEEVAVPAPGIPVEPGVGTVSGAGDSGGPPWMWLLGGVGVLAVAGAVAGAFVVDRRLRADGR